MKIILTCAILTLMTWSCANKQNTSDEKQTVKKVEEKTDTVFRQVAHFPEIKDTTEFISKLRDFFGLEVEESAIQQAIEQIYAYRKVKIYGSDNDYIFIEYSYGVGSMAAYPWKYQILLTSTGKLVKILSSQRYEFVTIFPNQNPFLMIVAATAEGNGGHEIYKISANTLENVYDGYFDYGIQTYDAHQDISIFEPHELNIEFKDKNKDGYNDIIFAGKKLVLGRYTNDSVWQDVENVADTISVEYVFVYDKETGHFKLNK